MHMLSWFRGFPGGKESTCQCKRYKRHGFNPWVGKILWRRKWEPTPVCLPGESHGRRILVGYSSWGCRVRNNLASKQTAAAAEWVHVLLTRFFEVKLEHLASISFSQCWSKIILISHCVCNRVLVSVLKWKGIFLSLSLNSKELLALCYFEKCLFLSLWWADSFSYIIA